MASIGLGLAMTETILILATLAQRFQPRLKTPRAVKLSARITLAPEGGLKMLLERRPTT